MRGSAIPGAFAGVAGMVFAIVAPIWLTSEGKLAVTKSCERKPGLVTELRESLQGPKFWQEQLQLLDHEIAGLKAQPEKNAQTNVALAKLNAEMDKMMQDLYRENPAMAPSPAQQRAKHLRKLADAIEATEAERMFEKMRLEDLNDLTRCRPKVAERAQR